MKRVLMAVVAAGLGCGMMLGCDEKKSDSVVDKAKAGATDAAGKMKDAAAGAADKAKDMGAAAADKAKDMGKAVGDKAADMSTALKGEVKNLMDTIKGKVDTLDKGGTTLDPAKKGEFDKAMTGIKSTWADMSKGFDGLSTKTGDAMTTALADLKTKGTELMATVKTTADKFGIKLN